jgi:hypothetical protein
MKLDAPKPGPLKANQRAFQRLLPSRRTGSLSDFYDDFAAPVRRPLEHFMCLTGLV